MANDNFEFDQWPVRYIGDRWLLIFAVIPPIYSVRSAGPSVQCTSVTVCQCTMYIVPYSFVLVRSPAFIILQFYFSHSDSKWILSFGKFIFLLPRARSSCGVLDLAVSVSCKHGRSWCGSRNELWPRNPFWNSSGQSAVNWSAAGCWQRISAWSHSWP